MRIADRLIAGLFGTRYLRRVLVARYYRELDAFLKRGQTITFPAHDALPDVSVIIPVYNGAHHLLRCLQSLQRDKESSFEVIIYDDCSQDRVQELAGKCRNVIFVQGQRNLGFIGAVNAAAAHARGRHLLLMNSDATLLEGKIDSLARMLDENRDWGMVGVRIKLASGKLQEAGCVIFKDGTTDGYLRTASADDPRALVAREVDYASGAFLLIRGSAFRDHGGLDRAYAPAYYEETDLAMRFRQSGLKTVYTPDILVEHFEFGSQPVDDAREAITDRKRVFLANWGQQLAAQEFGPPTEDLDCYSFRRTPSPRAILVIKAAPGSENPTLVRLAKSRFRFLCLFLLDGSPTRQARENWQLEPTMMLAGGDSRQLQIHLSTMLALYDAILAIDSATLATLQSLGHGEKCQLIATEHSG